MKEYYAEVKLSFGVAFESKNKKDFIEKLKDVFWEQNNIDLQDCEISNIKIINK